MKIAFVNHVLALGDGISTVIWNLAKSLAKEHEVTIFTFNSDYKTANGLQIQEVSMPFKKNKFINPTLLPLFQNKWAEVRNHLRQYQVINTQLYPANLIPLFPSKIKGPLHILTEWSMKKNPNFPLYEKIYAEFAEKVDGYATRHADRVIAPSVYVERYVKEKFGVDAVRMYIDGVDFSIFDKNLVSPNDIYDRYPALKDSPMILLVTGSLYQHKNVETLIKSLKIVRKGIPEAKLVIVGRYQKNLNYYRHLLELIQEEGLKDSIFFTGVVSWQDLPKYYAACDVYATCSLWEGFLRAEAFAMEKPMVAFDVTANSETIKHGENGLLVKELTSEAFASALLTLLRDDDLRAEMGRNGYQWAKENLDFDAIAQNFVKFVEESI